MAYEDAWRVCHPDFKRPFSSLEDACHRLLPYHVVADYEAEEEDDRIHDSESPLSRSQQWDHNIANKVAEFTATFEKQLLAFNLISQKRAIGELRSEERFLIDQFLLQEERQRLMEARAEMETRQKEIMCIRGGALGAQDLNPDEIMNGWPHEDENEDFLNDEEKVIEGGEFDLNTR